MAAFPPQPAESDSVEALAKQEALPRSQFVLPQHLGRMTLPNHRIVAVGLLTEHDLGLLGDGFSRAWPVDETPCFTGLLEAIDEADRELWRERDRTAAQNHEN